MAKARELDAALRGISIRVGKTAYPLGGKTRQDMQPRPLAYEAMRWSFVLRARERWVDNEEARARHQEDARATLLSFGLSDEQLTAIGQSGQVVVRMAYEGEPVGWAARIFPWEYVIASATRGMRPRADQRFAVMRELFAGGEAGRAPRLPPRLRLLFVQSAPGRLADGWGFDDEYRRLGAALGEKAEILQLRNPTLDALVAQVQSWKPDLLHLSGFDNVQGLRALREMAGPQTLVAVPHAMLTGSGEVAPLLMEETLGSLLKNERVLQDGFLMTSPRGRPCVVPALELAQALAGTRHQIAFAGVSVANSAPRTSALLVGEGAAAAAVGFQGDIDNTQVDYLFELLYAELAREHNVSAAFQRSWAKARMQPNARRATGIALWSSAELDTARSRTEGTAALEREGKGNPALAAVPVDELNYAVLHNTRPGGLFKSFVVERHGAQEGTRIEVDVEVHLGRETACWRKAFLVGKQDDRWDLAGEIHVPLTAGLVRSVREAVNSSVVVQLRVGDELVSRESHRVRLLPVDQWRDNDRDGQWLPSFVLPRDPAVMRAVQQAQRYVRVLRDDPSAGFEGYQVVGSGALDEEELTQVDLQVQALWATLVHEWQLGYINPPPTYSAALDSQRLRTPSGVQRNAAGTCLDLALLFAACLELVDIYPVVFLLEGHALPGYWRHHSFHEQFAQAAYPEEGAPLLATSRTSSAGIQKYPWQSLGQEAHRELARAIEARQLVPLETVRLTEYCGFVAAIEAGVEALAAPQDFHSMLDIVRARQWGVTPLPIVEDAA